MFIECESNKFTSTAFYGSWSEFALARAIAVALDGNKPYGVELSDEFFCDGERINFTWIEKKGRSELDRESVANLENKLLADLTICTNRRVEAADAGRTIVALPTDPKFLALNKAIHEANGGGVRIFNQPLGGPRLEIESRPPRDVLLINPPEEPEPISVDAVVSGSNVTGAPGQLPLFDDALVDVVYFVRDENYDEVRAQVPLSLASVANLATHIRVECLRNRPEDKYLNAIGEPELYIPSYSKTNIANL